MLLYLALIDDEIDKLKFEQVYNKYKQIMFYAANNILEDEYLAEDAVHSAFIRIAKNIDKIKINSEYETKKFVVVITKNIAIDIYRKSKKENIIHIENIEENIEDLSKDEDVLSDEILLAIDKLNINYKTVMSLKYSQGYSDREIAQIVGITEENVRKRLSRARIKLKDILTIEEVNING